MIFLELREHVAPAARCCILALGTRSFGAPYEAPASDQARRDEQDMVLAPRELAEDQQETQCHQDNDRKTPRFRGHTRKDLSLSLMSTGSKG